MSRLLLGILLASALLLTGCVTTKITASSLSTDQDNGVYHVDGAVLHPGEFNLPAGELLTLGQAIQRAGGFKPGNEWNDGGDSGSVRVSRLVHGSVVEYTLQAFPGGRDEEFAIRPGDYIHVPKRTFSTPIPNPLPFAT